MGILTFWGLVLALILMAGGMLFLSYWIPKRMGYERVGVILSRTLFILTFVGILALVFADRFFSKSDVRGLLAQHDIQLTDDFQLVSNSHGGFPDEFHTFELLISDNDKQDIINKMRLSENFSSDGGNNVNLANTIDTYSEAIIRANYENDTEFRRESYQTFGKGYAPSHVIISVDKKSNRLTFEEIVD